MKKKKEKVVNLNISDMYNQIKTSAVAETYKYKEEPEPVAVLQTNAEPSTAVADYLAVTITTDHEGIKYLVPTSDIAQFNLLVQRCIKNDEESLTFIKSLYGKFIVKDYNDKQLYILN